MVESVLAARRPQRAHLSQDSIQTLKASFMPGVPREQKSPVGSGQHSEKFISQMFGFRKGQQTKAKVLRQETNSPSARLRLTGST